MFLVTHPKIKYVFSELLYEIFSFDLISLNHWFRLWRWILTAESLDGNGLDYDNRCLYYAWNSLCLVGSSSGSDFTS